MDYAMTNTNHDTHYQTLKIGHIDVVEQKIDNPGTLPPKPLNCVNHALKYLIRAGLKEGEAWEKDVQKAINYLNRALTGEWLVADTKNLGGQSPQDVHTLCHCGALNMEGASYCWKCEHAL